MSGLHLPVVRTVAELRAQVRRWRSEGHRVALTPTIGAFHEGHLSLVRRAKATAARVVTSVFVNPSQFGPGEDFETYPRDEAGDAALLASVGCDLLYAPGVAEIYPEGFSTTVTVAGLTEQLEGVHRPGHFAGVATVVAKLLIQAEPDAAVFGEKDYQQLLVIRRMARDLDLPVEIIAAPTIREADGLALSSRNAYLSDSERQSARAVNLALETAVQALAGGAAAAAVEADGRDTLLRAGFERIDYFEARGADDLRRLGPGRLERDARVLTAAWIGRTRLIDNMAAPLTTRPAP